MAYDPQLHLDSIPVVLDVQQERLLGLRITVIEAPNGALQPLVNEMTRSVFHIMRMAVDKFIVATGTSEAALIRTVQANYHARAAALGIVNPEPLNTIGIRLQYCPRDETNASFNRRDCSLTFRSPDNIGGAPHISFDRDVIAHEMGHFFHLLLRRPHVEYSSNEFTAHALGEGLSDYVSGTVNLAFKAANHLDFEGTFCSIAAGLMGREIPLRRSFFLDLNQMRERLARYVRIGEISQTVVLLAPDALAQSLRSYQRQFDRRRRCIEQIIAIPNLNPGNLADIWNRLLNQEQLEPVDFQNLDEFVQALVNNDPALADSGRLIQDLVFSHTQARVHALRIETLNAQRETALERIKASKYRVGSIYCSALWTFRSLFSDPNNWDQILYRYTEWYKLDRPFLLWIRGLISRAPHELNPAWEVRDENGIIIRGADKISRFARTLKSILARANIDAFSHDAYAELIILQESGLNF